MGVLRNRFSDEEKEEIKQIILSMLSENDTTIANELGVSIHTAQFYINELIKENRLTQLKRDKAIEEKQKEEWEKKKAIVLEGVHEGKTVKDQMKAAKVGADTLEQMIQELIDERNYRRRLCKKKKGRSKKG